MKGIHKLYITLCIVLWRLASYLIFTWNIPLFKMVKAIDQTNSYLMALTQGVSFQEKWTHCSFLVFSGNKKKVQAFKHGAQYSFGFSQNIWFHVCPGNQGTHNVHCLCLTGVGWVYPRVFQWNHTKAITDKQLDFGENKHWHTIQKCYNLSNTSQ